VIRVAAAADIGPGTGMVVSAVGKALALFNVEGAYYAVDNTCPHRGGPLGEGDLDGQVVNCPWHGWSWDVTSGANVNNPAVRIGCYPVIVQEGALFVRLTS
jgi:3-phenylpropionate/trans-cinnamate dioxygenase ferredoxin component